jgi:ABC-type lipoprotein release transport system permease subunit
MLIAMVGVLATVALVASIVPAQRATRLEPTAALRIE